MSCLYVSSPRRRGHENEREAEPCTLKGGRGEKKKKKKLILTAKHHSMQWFLFYLTGGELRVHS